MYSNQYSPNLVYHDELKTENHASPCSFNLKNSFYFYHDELITC